MTQSSDIYFAKVFVYGFAKSERANMDDSELEEWRRVGRSYLGLDEDGIEVAIAEDELTEIGHGGEG